MEPETPRAFGGCLVDAHEQAVDAHEPIFVPTVVHADDRGWSLMNQLQGVMGPAGQVNFSVQYPGVIKAWHCHHQQTDFWLCLLGHIKAGVHRDEDGRSWHLVIGEKHPGVLVIPPNLWHGAATVGPQCAGLLYYVSHAYAPEAPDEQRRAFDSVDGFSWGVEPR